MHVKSEVSWQISMGTEGSAASLGCNIVRELSMT